MPTISSTAQRNRRRVNSEGPIGVFDSGAGGLSVLRALMDELPAEDFVYFGDSANTPYGEKPREWVRARSVELAEHLLSQQAKAIVVACNTATSAAAEILRQRYRDVPVIGVEPALKPAALAYPGGRILVMATPMTLHLEKFQHLADQWASGCTVYPVACEGLAARVEKGDFDAPDMAELLEQLVGEFRGRIDCAVLGCTHYPFVADQIRAVLGDVELFDGARGTARQVRRMVERAGLLTSSEAAGSAHLETSSADPGELDLYRQLLRVR